MKRPATFIPRRPLSGSRRVPTSRTGAAIELVRAEFERQRLAHEIAQCAARTRVATRSLERMSARSRSLHAALAEPEGSA